MLIRIFPNTRDEFESEDELKDWLNDELRNERNGRYRLRSTNGVGKIPPRNIVLFRFHDHIVGHATVADGIRPLNEVVNGIKYEALIQFEPASIRVYNQSLPIETLETFTGRDLSFGRAYFKFEDADDLFEEILAKVERDGFWSHN